MKARLPHPTHYSYEVHRKQVIRQIILPVVFAALVMIGLVVWISLVTFNQGGDAARWAAISTIWVLIPVMLAGLILLVLFSGLIYLLARALGALPYYTGLAQDYVYKGRGIILRGANMVVRPILAVDGFLENIRAFFGRITP